MSTFGIISGACLDHVLPSFTSRLARAQKFPRQDQKDLRNMSMECLLFWTKSGPCLDHVGTIMGQGILSEKLYSGTMSGPCFHNVKATFDLAILPDQVES